MIEVIVSLAFWKTLAAIAAFLLSVAGLVDRWYRWSRTSSRRDNDQNL